MDIHSQYFGRTPYSESLKIQDRYLNEVRSHSERTVVLGFEFDPVITLGIRGNPKEDLIGHPNVPVVTVPRGGQATLHSPGQIVIYPICNIIAQDHRVKSWVCRLLKVSAVTTEKLSDIRNIEVGESGLYVNSAKIASIGLKVVHGVSTFGVAINLKNDIGLFNAIRPCGVADQKIAEVAYKGDLKDFFDAWVEHFRTP